MKRENLKKFSSKKSWAAMLALVALTAGCGKQSYTTLSTVSQAQGAGSFSIPAKVDILLAEDDTGSMIPAYGQISSLVPQFLSYLQSSGWDYHFATIPMTHLRPITQVAASRYDSNWGSQWTPPFPGAQANGPGMIAPGFFQFPQYYSGFLTQAEVAGYANLGGIEPTFQNIVNTLYNSNTTGSHFLRPDSLLVILAAGNGDDTSGVKYCPSYQGSSQYVPCDTINISGYNPYAQSGSHCGTDNAPLSSGTCNATGGTRAGAINYYSQLFKSAHGTAQTKFYAAVSTSSTGNCQGQQAYAGQQYISMAAAMNGAAFNICDPSSGVSNALSQLASSLQTQRLSYRTHYIFIDSAPTDVSSIQVTKNGATVPQSSSNGWTYVGYTTVYAIDYPVPMNQTTGYAIQLNGSAELVGDDTASVTFK